MSNDDPPLATDPCQNAAQAPSAHVRSFFEIPPALKRIFDKFPLVTYAENDRPLRAPRREGTEHVLYIFTTAEEANAGRPSFNPACLKWQTYLRLCHIPHRTFASNNHASPSGALPFLLPTASDEGPSLPIPSSRLKRWSDRQRAQQKTQQAVERADVRYEAYQSLLDARIRIAWLHQLYLNPANSALLHRLYIAPCSTNPLAQITIGHQLSQAVETEIVKSTGSSAIAEADLERAAEEALGALSALLAGDQWFFGQKEPGLFDAAVFSYTHLLLGEELEWRANNLGEALKKFENLVQHRNRIAELYH